MQFCLQLVWCRRSALRIAGAAGPSGRCGCPKGGGPSPQTSRARPPSSLLPKHHRALGSHRERDPRRRVAVPGLQARARRRCVLKDKAVPPSPPSSGRDSTQSAAYRSSPKVFIRTPLGDYSSLNTTAGSVFAARSAGSSVATANTPINRTSTPVIVSGSWG